MDKLAVSSVGSIETHEVDLLCKIEFIRRDPPPWVCLQFATALGSTAGVDAVPSKFQRWVAMHSLLFIWTVGISWATVLSLATFYPCPAYQRDASEYGMEFGIGWLRQRLFFFRRFWI
jgi:hypothetical protein